MGLNSQHDPYAVMREALATIAERLRDLVDSPHTRELRGKAASYEKSVRGWVTVPPSEGQRLAMLDLLGELEVKVGDATRQRALDTSSNLAVNRRARGDRR